MNKDLQLDLNEIIDAFEMIAATGDDFSRSFANAMALCASMWRSLILLKFY